MTSQAATVDEYIAQLPEERRAVIRAVRETILKNLPEGYDEGMQYGMIGYYVPHSLYPKGYHCDPKQPLPYIALASQKNYMSVYLTGGYSDDSFRNWFEKAYADAGKKLDMGKSCVRFKKLEDLPLEVIGQAVARLPVKDFVANYEAALARVGQKGR